MPDSALLHVDRVELLRFYDDSARAANAKHATAINAMAGEELGLALFVDYLRRTHGDAELLDQPCTTGKRQGHWLDGWVRAPRVYYQVEVKNWSALSLGGLRFPLDASPESSKLHRMEVWKQYWDSDGAFFAKQTIKVLDRMKCPVDGASVEPVLVFWVSLHPDGEALPFYKVAAPSPEFDFVNVFSMSTYLRSLTDVTLELPLPKVLERISILERVLRRPS